jgi:ankyrin repeat protein
MIDVRRIVQLGMILLLLCVVSGCATDRRTELHEAISEGQEGRVKQLLREGHDVNAPNETGYTPLRLAVVHADDSMVSLLLSKGADPKRTSALHDAAACGKLSMIQVLVAHNADVNERNTRGQMPLHRAAFAGETEAVRLLIRLGAQVDARDDHGYTPLLCARDAETTRTLLDAGADVGATEKAGWAAIHQAAYRGDVETLAVLLSAGADVNARTNGGKTPLGIARSEGSERIVRMIRKAGGKE